MKYVRSTRTIDSHTTVVVCQGEMDTLAVEELRQAVEPLLADSTTHLILDMAAVEYVSSSVLLFLMVTQSKTGEKGGKVSLVGASELVRQVFAMASLDALFGFYGALEDLGIVQAPPASAKGKEKAVRKEKVIPLQEARTPAPAQTEAIPVKPAARSRDRARDSGVERIHPAPEQGSWKDYGVWIGIASVVAVSLVVSVYLYFTR